jgi:hypothetical protein
MNYFSHPQAGPEFFNAIEYYEDCKPGPGYDFSIEVYSAIERILSFPSAWPALDDEMRIFVSE